MPPKHADAVSDLGVPMRKRTEKACDQCRRRKTKCDGKASCKACAEIGLECSYGNRVKQTRGSQYVAHLEHRLRELEHPTTARTTASEPESPAEHFPAYMVSSDQSGSGSSASSASSRSMNTTPPQLSDGMTSENMLAGDLFSQPMTYSSEDASMSGYDGFNPIRSTRHSMDDNDTLFSARVILLGMSRTNYNAKCAMQHLDLLNMELNSPAIAPPQVTDYNPFANEDRFSTGFDNDLDPLQSSASMFDEYVNTPQAFASTAFQDRQDLKFANPFHTARGR